MVYVFGATDIEYVPAGCTAPEMESTPATARGTNCVIATAPPPQAGSATPAASDTVPLMVALNDSSVAVITGCITHFPELPAWCPKLWLTSKSTESTVAPDSSVTPPPGSFIFSPLWQPLGTCSEPVAVTPAGSAAP